MRKISILLLISVFIGALSLTGCKKDDNAAKKYLLSKIKFGTLPLEELIYNSANKITTINEYDFFTGTLSAHYDIAYNGNNVSNVKQYIGTELRSEFIVETKADNTLKKITYIKRDTTAVVDTLLFTFDYNSSKQIARINMYYPAVAAPANLFVYTTLTYSYGNVTTEKSYSGNDSSYETYDYVYDFKNSPFLVSEVSIPFLLYDVLTNRGVSDIARDISKNNVTSSTFTAKGQAPQITISTYEYNADNYPVKITTSGVTLDVEYLVK